MPKTNKNASSLTGAIAEELNQWLTQGKEKISTEKSLEGLEHWTSERIAFANNSAFEMIAKISEVIFDIYKYQYLSINEKTQNKKKYYQLVAHKLIEDLTEDYRLQSFVNIYYAKNNGKDIHSYPHKHHKLELVTTGYDEFGQFIIDQKAMRND
jgi:hypothetical protein